MEQHEMWEDLKPFRKFRSPIEKDHWHHADYEGVGQMAAVYDREFTEIVAMRAHCTMSWERLRHDNAVLGTPLVDGEQPYPACGRRCGRKRSIFLGRAARLARMPPREPMRRRKWALTPRRSP